MRKNSGVGGYVDAVRVVVSKGKQAKFVPIKGNRREKGGNCRVFFLIEFSK